MSTMGLNTKFKNVFRHTFVVCVLLRIISVSCNISGINRIVKSSTTYKTITPRVCNLESLSLTPNEYKLGFIQNIPILNKYNYNSNDISGTQEYKNTTNTLKFSDMDERSQFALYAKTNTNVPRGNQLSKAAAVKSATFDRLFGNPLDNLKSSLSKVTNHKLFGTVEDLTKVGAWYLGNLFYNNHSRAVNGILPLRMTVASLQMLASLPLLLFRWAFGLEAMPSFNVSAYQVEKVDFKKEGLLRSVRKSLKNGYSTIKAYVKTYKSVLVQASYFSVLQLVSTSRALMTPEAKFLKVFEPLFVSLFTYLFEGFKMDYLSSLSLLPVVAGLFYSNFGTKFDLESFLEGLKSTDTLTTYLMVLLYNLVSTLRKVESNKFFGQNLDKLGKNLTMSNLNTTVNLVGILMFVPFSLLESYDWSFAYKYLFKRRWYYTSEFLKNLGLSTLGLFATNYGSFDSMTRQSPVSQSLVKTLDSAFGGLLNKLFFDKKLTKEELLGSLLAIAGGLTYSLLKH